MNEREINEKLRQACSHAAPDVWDAVAADCGEQKNKAVVRKAAGRKLRAARLLSAAACLCLLIGSIFGLRAYRLDRAVDATVSLDVNPSIEIRVNHKERVLEVVPLNEDGKTIVGEMDFFGSSLDVAVHAIIGSMLRNGYLNELTNSILISVDNQDPARGAALQERLTAEVEQLLSTDSFQGAVLSQTVSESDELRTLAEQYGITAGKAQLIRAILSENPLHSFEELAPLSINELNLLLSRETAAATHMEVVGTASDKAYIGEARALEIALEKAGVTADSLTVWEIEMDTEHGVMVYDVEFRSGGHEYDYEIDAATGAVLKTEKEYRRSAAQGSASVPASAQGEASVPTSAQDGAAVPAPAQSGGQTGERITAERAREIALAHAGLTGEKVRAFRSELDREDGLLVYELSFRFAGYEYDYEIDAATGAIVKAEKEWDD